MRKINLSRSQLLKVLIECNYSKAAVANKLCVEESSIRRACKRLNIDTEIERTAAVAQRQYQTYTAQKSNSGKSVSHSTFVVIPDTHAHTVMWDLLALVCEFVHDFRPEHIVHIGDLMDYECLLGIQKMRYPSFDGRAIGTLEREFQAVRAILDMINKAAPKNCNKVFLEGNHEHRVTELIHKAPEFGDMFRLDKRIDMSDWKMKPYLEKYKIGKLNFIHGEFFGKYPVSKHLDVYQKNVVFGHTHTIDQDTKPSPMREIPIWGASVGCICNVNAEYMRNRSSCAEYGFGYGWYDKATGDFDCRPVRIIKGKFWGEGKKYVVS